MLLASREIACPGPGVRRRRAAVDHLRAGWVTCWTSESTLYRVQGWETPRAGMKCSGT